LYKIPANTLFMGKNLVFVPDCPSTNILALEMSQHSPVNEGTLVITDHQTAGKGQRGNVWEAEPCKNLTFSLILKPRMLAVNKQFFLNIVICLALKDYLKKNTSDNIYIKWPNDILVHGKKISGILIENQLLGTTIVNTVAGIGLNINQRHFNAAEATSLSLLTGDTYDLNEALSAILDFIESRYLQLRAGHYKLLMQLYLESMYSRDQRRMFSSNGSLFEGIIRGVDEAGKLRIQVGDEMRYFGVKEIRYV
jgi:BirA family transcriptional regulator, biotin operon repressor / biotin---[acetyl-CoA-carboxylase] ligase